ncbi:MAG TPA: peptide MFS transporter [Cyclobacteriaceae bacterium]|nr:peptide MFS transporter [Cyclobacteriaceae bacterium]
MDTTKTFFGHPRGLATLFFTEMWERFSYYGMRAILILFMTTDTAMQGMGLNTETAGAIYGLYTAGVYLLTLPGGWLADNVFGQRKAIWYGGIIIMLGHLLLAIPGSNNIFFLGLAFVAAGTGLLKPNVSTIVGDLYPEGGARRDAGFSVFYMGINLGAFLGPLVVSFLAEKVDWHLGFAAAAVGMFFGLIQFRLTHGYLGEVGIRPSAKEDTHTGKGNLMLALVLGVVLIVFLALLQFMGYIDLTQARGLAEGIGILIVTVTIFYFLYILVAGGLDADERKKVIVIFFLFIGAALFWSGFEQAGSTLNLFARDYTNRFIFGWEMPAGVLQNVNPGFVIILAPLFGALWVKLAIKNLNPATPLKFGFGLVLMGLGFLVMYFAAGIVSDATKPGMFFLILTYFLHTSGELTLSPVGLSATTKLAPKRYVGQMMGIWFVGASLGNLIAGLYAGGFDPDDSSQLPSLFMSIVQFAIGAGIVFVIISPVLRKWMGQVK